MELRVETESGPGGELQPAVVWFGSRRVPVDDVLDQWWGSRQRWWKVRTVDGLYILRRDDTGTWDLAAVPRE